MWRGSYHVPGTSGFDDAEDPMVGGVRVESTGLCPLLDMVARCKGSGDLDAIPRLQLHTVSAITNIPPACVSGFGKNHRRPLMRPVRQGEGAGINLLVAQAG